MRQRAVGIIRVSQVKGREGESFSSPQDQRDLIDGLCAEHDWDLVAVYEELQVSGDAPLEDRPGLSPAVTKVLTGAAEIIVGAHNERLWWNHEVRAQVLRLVGDAGGEVWAADTGRLSGGTAAEDFGGEVRTSADRFSRRQNAEKARKAVVRAVRRGVLPYRDTPPGITKDADGRPIHSSEAKIALEAFELRDPLRLGGQAPIREVRDFLAANGIHRSFHGVQSMLGNRLYMGELHFGDLANLEAMDPIVPRELFERVQTARAPRGRRPKSELLLARLDVLVCDEGARMTSGIQKGNGRNYPFYRCPTVGDCTHDGHRYTIGAPIVEKVVVDAVRDRLAGEQGTATAESKGRLAAEEAEAAQVALDSAIRTFAGFEDEAATRLRLEQLRDDRDRKVARAEQLSGLHSVVTVSAAADWDRLSLGAQRRLVRATVDRVIVGPSLGRTRADAFNRVTVHLVE